MSKDDKLYDVRVSGRYIKEGMLTKKNYESYIKKLPDVSEKSETLIIDEEETIEEAPEIENESPDEEGNEVEQD
ncbi:MAG: hypothetical protein MI865_03640 [Proteobacteria bacterium]|nr:hypothetical protein [Pseudomonadota bacterium]